MRGQRPSRGRAVRGAALVVIALLAGLAATSVARANFVAVAQDAAADATDPSPGRDLTAVALSHDRRTGELRGAIRLAGAPQDADAFVSLVAGTRTPTGCNGYPAVGFGSYTTEFGASWLRLDDASGAGPRGEADKTGYRAGVQKFEATDRLLAGQRLDCVVVTLSEPGNAANIYDAIGPVDLVGQPALALSLRGVPRALTPGRPRSITLRLANGGDAPTQRVRLAFGRARGLTVKPARRSVPAIAPGRSVDVRAAVTLSSRAASRTELGVRATAGTLAVRGEADLVRRDQPSGGGGGGGGSSVCTRWIPDLSGETGGSLILVPC